MALAALTTLASSRCRMRSIIDHGHVTFGDSGAPYFAELSSDWLGEFLFAAQPLDPKTTITTIDTGLVVRRDVLSAMRYIWCFHLLYSVV
jgi:hypothetical protein